MKKIFKLLPALVAAAAAMAACQTAPVESVEDSVALVPQTVEFTAGTPSTRTSFTEPDGNTYPVIWTGGEGTDVRIFPDAFANGAQAPVLPADEGKSASFKATLSVAPAASYTFYLLSPDCMTATGPGTHAVTFEVPEIQQPSETSVQEDAMILVAKSTPVSSLQQKVSFGTVKHWTAYVKLSLTNLTADIGDLYAVEISADEPLAGTWSYDYDTEETAVVEGVKRVEAHRPSPTGVWFSVAPADLAGRTLTITAVGTKASVAKEIAVPEGKKFEPGKIAILAVDMTDAATPAGDQTFGRISEARFVTESAQFVLATAADNLSYGISTTQEADYRPGVPVTKSKIQTRSDEPVETVVNPSEEVEVLTVETGTASGTWALKTKAGKYLAIDKDKNVALVSLDAKSTLSDWRIRYDNGECEIRNNATSYTYYLRYRKSDNKFLAMRSSFAGNAEGLAMYLRDGSGNNDWKKDPELRLAKRSLTLREGETQRLQVALCYSLSEGGVVTFESADPTIATVDADGNVTAVKEGEATITASVGETENYKAGEAVCTVTVSAAPAQPDWVELAPGLKWAKCNVGAETPEDYGEYYAWGETAPKATYGWDAYLFMAPGQSSSFSITTYQLDDGQTDGIWYQASQGGAAVSYQFVGDGLSAFKDRDYSDDVARQAWGGEWQTPSDAQLQWLADNCTWTWDGTKKGYTVTSKVSGYTSNSIFLPTPGVKQNKNDGTVVLAGTNGFYMGSVLMDTQASRSLRIQENRTARTDNYHRYQGFSVRPVHGTVPLTGLALDATSLTLEAGQTQKLTPVPTPAYASDASVEWTSSNPSVVSFDMKAPQFCYLKALKAGTATITAKSKDGGKTATCTVTVKAQEKEWVELAPGLKWATYNVGAEKPEDAGDYFGWGETEPKPQNCYNWEAYQFMTSGETHPNYITAYQVDDDNQDGIWYAPYMVGTNLYYEFIGDGWSAFKDNDYKDDAARANWGGEWQTPSSAQVQWLADNCTWTWDDTKKGYKLTSKVSGYTSKSIFLPAAGLINDGGSVGGFGKNVFYHTNDLYSTGQSMSLVRTSLIEPRADYNTRQRGLPVRPVHGTVAVTGLSLDETSVSLDVLAHLTLHPVFTPAYVSDARVEWTSSNPSVVSFFVKSPLICIIEAKKPGTAVITAKSKDGGKTATCTVTVKEKAQDWVEMAPGLKWATCNVGAYRSTDPGRLFAWGETVSKDRDRFDWDNYRFITPGFSNMDGISAYQIEDGNTSCIWYKPMEGTDGYQFIGDGKSAFKGNGYEDDTARQNWGGEWQTPSDAQLKWLIDNCTWAWDNINAGYTLTSKVSGYTSKSIFLPAAGTMVINRDWVDSGDYGVYMSNSLGGTTFASVDLLFRESTNSRTMGLTARRNGVSVRPVYGTVAVTGVSLSQSSLTLEIDRGFRLDGILTPTYVSDSRIEFTSSNPSVAALETSTSFSSCYVRAKKAGTAVITARTKDGGKTATCTVTVKAAETPLEAVDLGLSVKWANKNIGAASTEDVGDYFAWGEVTPKTVYSWETYKFCEGSDTTLTRYVTHDHYGKLDNKYVLEYTDDAARKNLEGRWRMPTKNEAQELLNNCTITSITLSNGKPAFELKSKKNGKSIILPVTNMKIGTGWGTTTSTAANIWLKERDKNSQYDSRGHSLNIQTRNGAVETYIPWPDRCNGLVIRAVDCSNDVGPTGVQINKGMLALNPGESETLTATVSPSNATFKHVVWKSYDPKVATVDVNGTVTAIKSGSATITATDFAEHDYTCNVTVKAPPTPVSIDILNDNQASLDPLYEKGALQITPTCPAVIQYKVTYSDGSTTTNTGAKLERSAGTGLTLSGRTVSCTQAGKSFVITVTSTTASNVRSSINVKTWDDPTSITFTSDIPSVDGKLWCYEGGTFKVAATVYPETAFPRVTMSVISSNQGNYTLTRRSDGSFELYVKPTDYSVDKLRTINDAIRVGSFHKDAVCLPKAFWVTTLDVSKPKMFDYVAYSSTREEYKIIDGGLRYLRRVSQNQYSGVKDLYCTPKSLSVPTGYKVVGVVTKYFTGTESDQPSVKGLVFPGLLKTAGPDGRYLESGKIHGFAIALYDAPSDLWSATYDSVYGEPNFSTELCDDNISHIAYSTESNRMNGFNLSVAAHQYNKWRGSSHTIQVANRAFEYGEPGVELPCRAFPRTSPDLTFNMRPWFLPTVWNWTILADENGKLYNSPAMHRLNIQLETVGWDSNRVPLFHLVFPSASSSYWTINESTSFMSMIVNADGPAECDKRSTRSVRPFMIF